MPISQNITQPSGVVTTYNVLTGFYANLANNTATVNYSSYLVNTDYAGGKMPVATNSVDVSPFIASALSAATLTSQLETYLIGAAGVFNGGTQVP